MLKLAISTVGYEYLCKFDVERKLEKFRTRRSKVFVGISKFLVFSKSRIQDLWQGEISVSKVLLTIKVVPVKNDYFLHSKFKLHRYQQMNEFLYWCNFY